MATSKSGTPNKSAFIRGLPPELSAADAVEKGKAAGLTFTTNFVSAIRSKAKAGSKPQAKKAAKAKGRPGRKPGAKRGPKPKDGQMSASDFVRSMPAAMKAGDVLTAAKAKGLKMSRNLVYAVRRAASKKTPAPATVKGKPGRKPRALDVGASNGDVLAFKKMAFNLGISRARQALDELERGLKALLG